MGRMTKRRIAGSHASWNTPLLQRLHPKADHQECLHALSKDPAILICFRLAQLARVEKLGAELAADQARASAVAAWAAQTRAGVANPFGHQGYGHPVTVPRRDARYKESARVSLLRALHVRPEPSSRQIWRGCPSHAKFRPSARYQISPNR